MSEKEAYTFTGASRSSFLMRWRKRVQCALYSTSLHAVTTPSLLGSSPPTSLPATRAVCVWYAYDTMTPNERVSDFSMRDFLIYFCLK